MRGLMAKPDGWIIETPITANFREGLNVLQYFISTHGARKGLADTALKTANSGYLTRRLVDVTQDLVVTENDCGTQNGMNRRALVEGGEVIESLRDRILGRVTAVEVLHPETQEVMVPAGEMLDEDTIDVLEAAGVDEVKVRTALTCDTRFGICAKCYGRDLGRGGLVNVGEAIGVIAAQSIGEPGTQLTMRTFHIGGAASRAAVASSVDAKSDGIIGFNATMRYVTNGKGELVVISRSGEIVISDPHGRERERHKLPYGATLNIKPDQQVKAGTVLANWDPLTRPIITEFAGRAKFENVEEGDTVAKQVDEVTGLSTLVVIDPKRRGAAKVVRPQVKLLDAAGIEVKIPGTDHAVTIGFPVGALIQVRDGQDLAPGRSAGAHPDGRPEDARHHGRPAARGRALRSPFSPKDVGTLAEITGTISFGKETKGKNRLQITDPEGTVHEELVAKEKNILVHEGQVVNRGELVVDGTADPQDILRLLGIEELARYIVDEVQDVYRLQGVKINDKHIEVIVRQMLRRVQIINAGDSSYINGEQVERSRTARHQRRRCAPKARCRPRMPTCCWASPRPACRPTASSRAASFQETTRVLTEAAIMGKRDELRGLKENVIVGRLIPAGTGMAFHEARKAKEDMDESERRAIAHAGGRGTGRRADGAGRRGHRGSGGRQRDGRVGPIACAAHERAASAALFLCSGAVSVLAPLGRLHDAQAIAPAPCGATSARRGRESPARCARWASAASMKIWSSRSLQRSRGAGAAIGSAMQGRVASKNVSATLGSMTPACKRRMAQHVLQLGAHRRRCQPAQPARQHRLQQRPCGGVAKHQPVQHDLGVEHEPRRAACRRPLAGKVLDAGRLLRGIAAEYTRRLFGDICRAICA